MARRKSAQKKARKQPIRKSIVRASKFPAERLPSELIHMIFTYLEPTEAATFRLVGRVVAEVGLQYLAPTVYLALNEESYDRLLAIAEHPIVSKYVVKLEYETEGLKFINRHQWDQVFKSTTISDSLPEEPNPCASARAWRAYDRGRQTTKALNRAWLMYEAYHASQKRVKQAQFFPQKTAEAMKQLRNLTKISASGDGAYKRYVAETKKILPTYYLPPHHRFGRPSIADTTSSILSAAESADLRFHHFLTQSINLQIFVQIKDNLASLKKSMLHLETMNLSFAELQRDREEEDASINMEILEKGYVLDLVTSAPNLQHLSLAFSTWDFSPWGFNPWGFNPWDRYFTGIPFNKTIGGFYWPFLKAVSLVSLCSHEQELWCFFGRHARTLKHVSLENMRHYEGSWQRTFQEMRRKFAFGKQLKTCRLSGYFSSPGSRVICVVDTVISDYIQATDFEDISLNEYCEITGVPSVELS